MRPPECVLGLLAGDVLGAQIDQKQMAVGAAGHDAQSPLLECVRHRLRIGQNLLLVRLESGLERLLESHRLGRDHVHQRPALVARKYGRINRFLVLRTREYKTAARAAERLVRGAGDKIGDAHRRRVQTRRDQPGVMGNVGHQQRTDAVGNRAETQPVDRERISRGAGDYHLRLVLARQALDLGIVNDFGGIEPITECMVNLAARADRRAMRQMAAVREGHAEDSVAGLEHRRIHREIGLRSGMRLHVRVLGIEQFLGTIDRELLGNVNVLATAVIALAGIAFSVFVRQNRTLRREHARTCVVLGCDQLDMVFLTLSFVLDRRPQFRIEAFDGVLL